MIIYIRPEGAAGYDEQYEYGNRSGVEASISFITNPLNPHSLRPDKDPGGVSVRFDREGRAPDEAPNSPDRDPTREDGLISLDVSSIIGKKESPATRIGRLFAAGNRLRAKALGTLDSLHHNILSDQTYGKAENFAGLARRIETELGLLAGRDKLAVRNRLLGGLAAKPNIDRAA